jgi:nitrile hydratase accessory protein
MSAGPAPSEVPSLPRDDSGPVFREPWEAQAFAMAVRLHAEGHFTWSEWAQRLGAEIKVAAARGEPDTGEDYYLHWLRALEGLVAEKGLLTADELARRKDAWERAALATPHGRPIVLGADEV